MDEKEFFEILRLLKEAGEEVMVCDAELPLMLNRGVCGIPQDPGDGEVEEMIMIPKKLVDMGLQYFMRTVGDSMKDLGIEDGDMLRVSPQLMPRDNDVVVAYLDREATVKTLITDEDGSRWLVPANDAFDPICLNDKDDVRIFGVVVANEKRQPRMSTQMALKSIRRVKKSGQRELDEESVNAAVKAIAPFILMKRHWFPVMRVLQGQNWEKASSYAGFCDFVKATLPEHCNLPSVRELQRMDVQSFSKPVRMWQRDDAPVDGKRFNEYVAIATRFQRQLNNYR